MDNLGKIPLQIGVFVDNLCKRLPEANLWMKIIELIKPKPRAVVAQFLVNSSFGNMLSYSKAVEFFRVDIVLRQHISYPISVRNLQILYYAICRFHFNTGNTQFEKNVSWSNNQGLLTI